jgi:hypothetical protein
MKVCVAGRALEVRGEMGEEGGLGGGGEGEWGGDEVVIWNPLPSLSLNIQYWMRKNNNYQRANIIS